jgi:hypothetical protein
MRSVYRATAIADVERLDGAAAGEELQDEYDEDNDEQEVDEGAETRHGETQ